MRCYRTLIIPQLLPIETIASPLFVRRRLGRSLNAIAGFCVILASKQEALAMASKKSKLTQLQKFNMALTFARDAGCAVWPKLGKFQLWRDTPPEPTLIMETRKIDEILAKLVK